MGTNIFSKRNPIPQSQSLVCEVRGLQELKKFTAQHGLNIPHIVNLSSDELKMEHIHAKQPSPQDWTTLGTGLAKLHQVKAKEFGFESDNFIGLNKQINSHNPNWGAFFCENRLIYQTNLITNSNLKNYILKKLNQTRSVLIDFLNVHNPQPSLVHGDLWSGNVLFDHKGPWLIDPAVYYGDRETDLAMTEMFGKFSPLFYEAYQQAYPLPQGFTVRKKIYNMYHFLNHLNLFGQSYMSGVEEGLQAIERL